MRLAFIHAEKAEFTVSALCRVLGVTRQGYYAFAKRPPSARVQDDEALCERVREAHVASRETYGSPRVQRELRCQGFRVGKRRIERVMRSMGLSGHTPRRFRVTTSADPTHSVAPNTLDREFTASRPNERWVTDITYVWTDQGWAYLAAIIDLYSRAIVGWALDATMATSLPLDALEAAVRRRRPRPGLLHHSDRGCQYTSADYRAALDELGAVVSMSRKGNCWDNAVAESFFATLKKELLHRKRWSNLAQLRAALFEYIEVFYNRRRLHSSLDYKTPANIEIEHALANAA